MASAYLSAILITKNEAADLPACLESLSIANEIIVVDSDSSDDTRLIAQRAGARVFAFNDWPGYGEQKQRALDLATGDWVLSIDADERVTPELASVIKKIMDTEPGEVKDGYAIQRFNYFLSKRLRFGGWGNDFVVRLARRSRCKFDRSLVHEKLLVDGSVGRIYEPLVHLSYSSRKEVLEKRRRYAEAGALRLSQSGKSCSGVPSALSRAGWSFLKHCVLQFGFVDGPIGVYAAYCKAAETFLKYCCLSRISRS
jgi:glycosyltransferase involved in cell wall biosynthesis